MANLILLSEFQKTQIELWKPVDGFPNYEVSSLGRLRSFHRMVRGTKWKDGFTRFIAPDNPVLLKPYINKVHGYVEALLALNGKYHHARVHRLVARAFHPNPNSLPEVNHINAIKIDNRAANLEWKSKAEHKEHTYSCGLVPCGERHGMSKLTEDEVRVIRFLKDEGHRTDAIANYFGISDTTVRRVYNRQVWGHVV